MICIPVVAGEGVEECGEHVGISTSASKPIGNCSPVRSKCAVISIGHSACLGAGLPVAKMEHCLD